jgi:hypothetical protein
MNGWVGVMPVLNIAMDGWMGGCNASFKDCYLVKKNKIHNSNSGKCIIRFCIKEKRKI